MRKIEISWVGFDEACQMLIGHLYPLFSKPLSQRPNGILPVPRGGLIPATILSYSLRLPILDQREAKDELSNLLIVDDVCDTGKTFTEYKDLYPNALFVAPIVKPIGESLCHYWSVKIPQDYWIVFPWAPNDEVNRSA